MDSLNAPFLKVISEVFCSASINGCVPLSWFLRSHFNSIRRDTMVQKITSLDELWPIPETVRNLVYLSEGGLKFTIFDYRPFDYLITQSAPDDCHFIYLGGESRNVVFGNDTFNRIHGYGGDDILHGGENLDIIFGGSGRDHIWGYDGNDKLHGGHGHDSIDGMEGDDFITGGYGNDILLGHLGDDEIHSGYGNDVVRGGEDNEILYGFDGIDLITGDSGDDINFGGRGDDFIYGHVGTNIVTSGEGRDTIFLKMGDELHLVTDLTSDDNLAVIINNESGLSIDEILSRLDIPWETGQYQWHASDTNDANIDDIIIYQKAGTDTQVDDLAWWCWKITAPRSRLMILLFCER